MSSDDTKKLREMRRKLIGLELDTWSMELEGQPPFVLSTMREAIRNHSMLLRQHESELLVRKAESWGIEVEEKPDWRTMEYISQYGIHDNYTDTERIHPVRFLSEKGRTMITKQIREARFAYWKGWAEILIPILSLIVAILALLKTKT